MKLSMSALQQVVSRMVQEEIERLLPTLVAENISEIYLRGLVSEAVSRRAPGPRPSPARAPVQERTAPPARRDPAVVSALVSRGSNPLLEDKNPFRDIYEGTVPIDVAESAPPADDADLDKLGFSLGPAALARLAGIE